MQGQNARSTPTAQSLSEELARLKVKYDISTDRDIRSVLKMRMDQIETDLQSFPPVETKVEVPILSVSEELATSEVANEQEILAATPQQVMEADRLISQARVEKMRGNGTKATELLQSAAQIAPGSATVMEALGDNFMERKQVKAAIEAYKKAFKLAPKNVAVEEKLANAALQGSFSGSIEDQLRMGLNDSPFLTSQDIVARKPFAILLTVIFPGAGHVAFGKNAEGLFILVSYLVCGFWVLIMRSDLEKLFRMAKGQSSHPNLVVLVPIGIMGLLFFGALTSISARGSSVSHRKGVDRPKPPVDLPF